MSKEAVEEFKRLYKEEFEIILSEKEAQERAKKLLVLFKGTYKQP